MTIVIMAKYINNQSSSLTTMTRFLDQESTVLASCYSVESASTTVQGFHYCTTLGAGKFPLDHDADQPLTEHQGLSGIPEVPSGTKSTILSPPRDIPATSAELAWTGNIQPEHKGEAIHTIPEECERLFCDKLSTIFLGERIRARQESLGMDVFQDTQQNQLGSQYDRIKRWIEVWDYTADTIYRGFVADMEGEKTLFVFLEDKALGNGLKSG